MKGPLISHLGQMYLSYRFVALIYLVETHVTLLLRVNHHCNSTHAMIFLQFFEVEKIFSKKKLRHIAMNIVKFKPSIITVNAFTN